MPSRDSPISSDHDCGDYWDDDSWLLSPHAFEKPIPEYFSPPLDAQIKQTLQFMNYCRRILQKICHESLGLNLFQEQEVIHPFEEEENNPDTDSPFSFSFSEGKKSPQEPHVDPVDGLTMFFECVFDGFFAPIEQYYPQCRYLVVKYHNFRTKMIKESEMYTSTPNLDFLIAYSSKKVFEELTQKERDEFGQKFLNCCQNVDLLKVFNLEYYFCEKDKRLDTNTFPAHVIGTEFVDCEVNFEHRTFPHNQNKKRLISSVFNDERSVLSYERIEIRPKRRRIERFKKSFDPTV